MENGKWKMTVYKAEDNKENKNLLGWHRLAEQRATDGGGAFLFFYCQLLRDYFMYNVCMYVWLITCKERKK